MLAHWAQVYNFQIYNFILIVLYRMQKTPFLQFPFLCYSFPQIYMANDFHQCFLSHQNVEISKESQAGEPVIENNSTTSEFHTKLMKKKAGSKANEKKKQERREKLKNRRYREDNFQRKKQKKDRNLPSKILKNFFYFIFDGESFEMQAKRLQLLGINISYQILVKKLKSFPQIGKMYIRPTFVRDLCRQGILTSSESLVLRLIVKHFLLMRFPMSIICHMKFKRSQRGDYLRVCRKLYEQIAKQQSKQ